MSLAAGFTLYGADELMRGLAQLQEAARGQALLAVATPAGLVVMNAAKENLAPHSQTGDLENSVCIGGIFPPEQPTRGTDIQPPDIAAEEVSIYIGSNHPAARRRELGFTGIDRLGRNVHDPGRPYLRPAFDTSQVEAMIEAAQEVRALFSRIQMARP